MPSTSAIDHRALFEDVLAVVRTAQGATAGWRTICVRTQRKVGKEIIRPLSELDLDGEVTALAANVRRLVVGAPADVETLVFGLFDLIDVDPNAGETGGRTPWEGSDPKRVFTGFHITGLATFDPSLRWLPRDASWCPDHRFLTSPALDAIAKAAASHREVSHALAVALRFGAAALLGRFAAEGLPHRVLVSFDEGDFAEICALSRTPA